MLLNNKYLKCRERKHEKSFKICPFKTYLYLKLLKLLITHTKVDLKEHLPYVLIATNFWFQPCSVTKNFVYDKSKSQEINLRK